MEAEDRSATIWIQEIVMENGEVKDWRKSGYNTENHWGCRWWSGAQHESWKGEITQRKPDNVRRREEAAERCTEVIKRGVLKKHARKATTEHLVKSSLAPGEKKVRGKPLSELYANGDVTEDVEERQQQLERQCGEVYTDQ